MPIVVKNTFQAPSKADYRVIKELSAGGRVAGRRRALGEIISLTEAEARFLLLDGVIEPAAATPAPAPSPAPAPKAAKAD